MTPYNSVRGYVSGSYDADRVFDGILENNPAFIFHKATGGREAEDSKCISRIKQLEKTDTLLGLYHILLTKKNFFDEVDHFLTVVRKVQSETSKELVLALMCNTDGIQLEEVEDFIQLLYARTGKYPVVRGNLDFFIRLIGAEKNSILTKCTVLINRWNENIASPLDDRSDYLQQFTYWTECVMWQKEQGGPILFKYDREGALLEFWQSQACPQLEASSPNLLSGSHQLGAPSTFFKPTAHSSISSSMADLSLRPYHGLDFSHHNSDELIKELLSQNPPPKFVVHKITEGMNAPDDRCQERAPEIIKQKFLFGVYHFWSRLSEPLEQLHHFFRKLLEIMQNTSDDSLKILAALDLEEVNGNFPILSKVENFIKTFYKITGQQIVIYGAPNHLNGILKDNMDSFLRKHPLWLANAEKDKAASQDTHSVRTSGETFSWRNRIYLSQYVEINPKGKYDANYFQGDSSQLAMFWDQYSLSKPQVEKALYQLNQIMTPSLRP